MFRFSTAVILFVLIILHQQVEEVGACVGDTGLYCASCGNVGPNWNVCAQCQPGYGGRGCCACGQPPGKSCPSTRHCFYGSMCLTHCCNIGIDAACQECDGTGGCSKCDTTTHYLNPTTSDCEPRVVNGGNCTNNITCDSADCRGGKCCTNTTVASCAACGPTGECAGCGAGFHLEGTTCCSNNVSNCAKCNDVGWCSVCKPGWTLRGITCIPSPTVSMSITVSVTKTVTPPPTATKSAELTLSASPTFSVSIASSVSLTRTVTPPPTPTRSSSMSATVQASATYTSAATGSTSGTLTVQNSQTLTESATVVETESASRPPTASLTATITPPPTHTNSKSPTLTDVVTESSSVEPTASATATRTRSTSVSVSELLTDSMSASATLATPTRSNSLLPPEPTPAPPLPPGEPCEPRPNQAVSYATVPVFELPEAALSSQEQVLEWNVSSAWLSLSQWADRRYSLPRTVDPSDFVVTFVPSPAAAPSDTGMIRELTDGGRRVRNTQLQLIGSRYVDLADGLRLTMGPFPGYEIFDGMPEVLEVYVTSKWYLNGTRYCGNDDLLFELIAEIIIQPEEERWLADVRAASEVFGTAATIGSVMIGSSAAADMAALAILADASCARPSDRRVGGNSRLIAPFNLDDSLAGMLWGNGILIVVATAIHVASVGALYIAKRNSRHETLTKASAMLRFPAFSLALHTIMHPSVTYLSFKMLILGDLAPGDEFAAVIGVMFAIASPVVTSLIAAWKVDAIFMEYDYDTAPAPDRKYPFPPRWIRPMVPWGRWEPSRMRRRFGIVLSPFCKTHPAWFAVVAFPPSILALCMSPVSTDPDTCTAQLFILFVLLSVFAVFLTVTRPFRSTIGNFTAVLSATLLGFAALLMALQILHPTNPRLREAFAAILLLQVLLTGFRVLYTVASFLFERTVMRGIARFPKLRRMPWRCKGQIAEKDHFKKGDNRAFYFDIEEDELKGENKNADITDFDDLMVGNEPKAAGLEAPLLLPGDSLHSQVQTAAEIEMHHVSTSESSDRNDSFLNADHVSAVHDARSELEAATIDCRVSDRSAWTPPPVPLTGTTKGTQGDDPEVSLVLDDAANPRSSDGRLPVASREDGVSPLSLRHAEGAEGEISAPEREQRAYEGAAARDRLAALLCGATDEPQGAPSLPLADPRKADDTNSTISSTLTFSSDEDPLDAPAPWSLERGLARLENADGPVEAHAPPAPRRTLNELLTDGILLSEEPDESAPCPATTRQAEELAEISDEDFL